MAILNKDETLFQRGQDGKVLPKMVAIVDDPQKHEIKMVPLLYVDFRNVFEHLNEKNNVPVELQLSMIKKCIIEPEYSDADLQVMTPIWVNRLFNTIIINSQITENMDGNEKKNSDIMETKNIIRE